MKKIFLFAACLLSQAAARSQPSYVDSARRYIDNYVSTHEVVKGEHRKRLHFYPANEQYRVVAAFERKEDMPWFVMPTSSPMKMLYRVYGTLSFTIRDTLLRLNLYQSQSLLLTPAYKDYLFLPFTDATSGTATYQGGRYIDLKLSDVNQGQIVVDFNKAYNPYCAYGIGQYHCPLPPKENHLPVAIEAGEQAYGGH